jgi:CRISPR-associated protein Cas2
VTECRLWLVSYDISDRRRWRRVFKLMRRSGEHVQLPVFPCRLTPARMARLRARLAGLIDPNVDRLLVVELGPAATRVRSTAALASLRRAARGGLTRHARPRVAPSPLLARMADPATLLRGWQRVRHNRGAAGGDNVTVAAFGRLVRPRLADLAAARESVSASA